MNFKDSYKNDNDKIKLRKEVLISLSDKMRSYNDSRIIKKSKLNYKVALSIVAALLIFSTFIFSNIIFKKEGIYVPKQQLGVTDPNIAAKRAPTLVYKNRVYIMEVIEISLEEGKALMDKKIGVTWNMMGEIVDNGTSEGYIDLESLEDFASFGEGDEVYTAKGYDENFRLITYSNNEYGEYINLWQCLNDFTLEDGSDVFGKMNIKGNLESITWESFNNWNNGLIEEKEVIIDDTVNRFIDAMYKGVPYSLEDESLRSQLFDNEENQKFMFLKMKDGTKAQIRLFKDGYVYYSGLEFVFKLDEETFNTMWNKLVS
ncbi:hypothetical protein R0131_14755 [Clostridium sp. AL.422]|uniref:hypothetical protein n=1 Tax=Clostridium TaxID=1485 RepID=UPI00293DE6ED|nr:MULTISPECIES: hypothetical protein [unclassified Clostridium]MDV4152087.1 hypothetical protein [Clostridium sp. AL.422]